TLLGDQTVTRSRLREQVAGAQRIQLDLAPQPRDVDLQVVRAVAALAAPDLVEDHPVGQQPSLVAGEEGEQVELDRRDLNSALADEDRLEVDVDRQVADAEHAFR